MNILFVTWDGPQVSYLEGLFLPIFDKLQARGMRFHVLQFTWADPARIALARDACCALGISYQSVRIMRWPRAIGALVSAVWGAWHVRRAVHRHAIDVVMPRSTMPGLSVLLGVRANECPIVFDADGLPLDERVDFAGQSPSSPVHRLLRDIEAQVVRRASVVLTRSAKASDILLARAGAGTGADKFHVVSNGRDAQRFHTQTPEIRSQVREQVGISDSAPLLVYAGSTGPQYCVVEMLQLFQAVRTRRPEARMLVLSQSPDYFLATMASVAPDASAAVVVMAVQSAEVPVYLATADLGLALRRPSFSMQGIAPIKLGEYLLCGVPVIATSGIGDADAVARDAGLLVTHMGSAEVEQTADWFVETVLTDREDFRLRCRQSGKQHFSLEASVDLYVHALEHMERGR